MRSLGRWTLCAVLILMGNPASAAMMVGAAASSARGRAVRIAPIGISGLRAGIAPTLSPTLTPSLLTSLSPLFAAPSIETPLVSAALPGAALPSMPAPLITPAKTVSPKPASLGAGIVGGLGRAVEAIKKSVTGERNAETARFNMGKMYYGDGDRRGHSAVPQGRGPEGLSSPDTERSWYDYTTGEYETQASKIRKTLELAAADSLGGALKNAIPFNTLYEVDNSWEARYSPSYIARTIGDDPEDRWTRAEDAAVIFTDWAVRNLSPHFLAAKLASMWMRQLYRDDIPESAEKTYVEGSVFARVFKSLTGSTARDWNGARDWWNNGNFEAYRHYYHWLKGFAYDNVRQGPYFLEKIMRAVGDPWIHTSERGRKTLYQRAQDREITEEQATEGQAKFDTFVNAERGWVDDNR